MLLFVCITGNILKWNTKFAAVGMEEPRVWKNRSKTCTICDKKFRSPFVRRHHCRLVDGLVDCWSMVSSMHCLRCNGELATTLWPCLITCCGCLQALRRFRMQFVFPPPGNSSSKGLHGARQGVLGSTYDCVRVSSFFLYYAHHIQQLHHTHNKLHRNVSRS